MTTPKERHEAAINTIFGSTDNRKMADDIVIAYLRALAEPDKDGRRFAIVQILRGMSAKDWLKEIEG